MLSVVRGALGSAAMLLWSTACCSNRSSCDPLVEDRMDHAARQYREWWRDVVLVDVVDARLPCPNEGDMFFHGESHRMAGGAGSAWMIGRKFMQRVGSAVSPYQLAVGMTDNEAYVRYLPDGVLLVVALGEGKTRDGKRVWLVVVK